MRILQRRPPLLAIVVLVALSLSDSAHAGSAKDPVQKFGCLFASMHACVTAGQGAEACPDKHLCLFDGRGYNFDLARAQDVFVTDLVTKCPHRRDEFATGCRYISLADRVSSSNNVTMTASFENRTSSFVNNTPHRVKVYRVRRGRPTLWTMLNDPGSFLAPGPVIAKEELFTMVPWARYNYVTRPYDDQAALLEVVS